MFKIQTNTQDIQQSAYFENNLLKASANLANSPGMHLGKSNVIKIGSLMS